MPPPGRSRWSASAAGLVTGSSAPGTPDACPPPSMPRPAAGESPMPARISAAGCGSSACLAAHLMAHRDVLFAVLRELWPRNRSPPWLTTVRRAHARRQAPAAAWPRAANRRRGGKQRASAPWCCTFDGKVGRSFASSHRTMAALAGVALPFRRRRSPTGPVTSSTGSSASSGLPAAMSYATC